ncbi:unnamed protein product [Sphagnum balticum]
MTSTRILMKGNDEHVLDYRKKLDDKPPYENTSRTIRRISLRSVLIDLLNSFKKWGDNKSIAIQEINEMRTKDLETSFVMTPEEHVVASTVKSKDTVGSEDTAGHKEILKCSSKEYYHRCRMTFAAKQKQRYYDDNAMFTQKIKAVPSNKVKNENDYLEFLKYALEHVVEFLEFHHGAAGTGVQEHLRKWCKTVDVDEFRTSKLCYHCHSETEKVSYGDVKINSVLRCMNNECGMIVDRDINGANNIGSLFHNMIQGKERPEAFSRLLVADEKRSNR